LAEEINVEAEEGEDVEAEADGEATEQPRRSSKSTAKKGKRVA
jgi:hypothetical protein